MAGTYTTNDRCKDKCINALSRLRKTTPVGFHWTSLMITVLLRFVYHAVVNLNWSWSGACKEAGNIFHLKPHTVHKMGMLHRDAPDQILPPELPTKKRGRGSDTFKVNDADGRFKVIKDHHLSDILGYVRERNRSMSGVCTVRSIMAYMFQRTGLLFKYNTVRYALKVRLGLKFHIADKKRLVFTPGRICWQMPFVRKFIGPFTKRRQGLQLLSTWMRRIATKTTCPQRHGRRTTTSRVLCDAKE